MSEHRPWFLVMTPKDANQPGSEWARRGAASRGKVVVRPITVEGWLSLVAFIVALVIVTLVIWLWGFRSGTYSLTFAILATVLVVGIEIAAFVRLIYMRMTTLPPAPSENQSRQAP